MGDESKKKIDDIKAMLTKRYKEYRKKVEGKTKPSIPIKFRIRDTETKKIVAYETIKYDGIYRSEILEDGTVTEEAECMQYFDGIREQFTGGFDKENTEVYQRDIILIDEQYLKDTGGCRLYCLVDMDDGGFKYGRGYDPFVMNSYTWMALRYPDKIPSIELKSRCIVAGDVYNDFELLEEILEEQ